VAYTTPSLSHRPLVQNDFEEQPMTTAVRSGRLMVLTLTAVMAANACARSPEARDGSPTAPSPRGLASSELSAPDVSGIDLATCLVAPVPSCFSGARITAANVDAAPVTSPPLNLTASVNGSTVVLVWTAPAVQDAPVNSYLIEVGSSPFAAADLASFDTGNAATTLTAPLIPPGTYYVRLRARNALGLSQASAQIQVVVGAPGPAPGCPGAPRALSGSVAAGVLTLTWLPPLSGVPQAYIIEAGSAPGAANIASFNTGTTATSFVRAGVPAGVYYIRVRTFTAACGASAPSNEAIVSVASTPTGNPLVTLTLAYFCGACTGDPDNYALNVDCVSGRCTTFRTSNARSSGVITANVRMAPGVHNVEVVVRNPSSPWQLTFTASPPGTGGVVPSSFRVLFQSGGLSLAPCRVSGTSIETFFEFSVSGPSIPTC
jgi:hypothetical protein